MPLSPRDPANLWDMLEASKRIQLFLKDQTFEDFLSNDMLRAAVERNLEIIGEAGRRLSEELRQEYPEIPWRKIIALRNVLIHEYDDIDLGENWKVASFHVPKLIDQIKDTAMASRGRIIRLVNNIEDEAVEGCLSVNM